MPSNRAREADARRSHLRPTSRASRGRSLPLWTSPLLLPRASLPPNFSFSLTVSVSLLFLCFSLPRFTVARAFTYTKRDVHVSIRRQRCVRARYRSSALRISCYFACNVLVILILQKNFIFYIKLCIVKLFIIDISRLVNSN